MQVEIDRHGPVVVLTKDDHFISACHLLRFAQQHELICGQESCAHLRVRTSGRDVIIDVCELEQLLFWADWRSLLPAKSVSFADAFDRELAKEFGDLGPILVPA